MSLPQAMTMIPGTPEQVGAAVSAEVLEAIRKAVWTQDEPAEVLCQKLGLSRSQFNRRRKQLGIQQTRVVNGGPMYRPEDWGITS